MKPKVTRALSAALIAFMLSVQILPFNYWGKLESASAETITNSGTADSSSGDIQSGVEIPQKSDVAEGVDKVTEGQDGTSVESQKEEAKQELEDSKNAKFKKDTITLKVADEAGKSADDNRKSLFKKLKSYNVAKLEPLFTVDKKASSKTSSTWYKATLKSNTDVVTTLQGLLKEDYILSAEPDYIRESGDIGQPTITSDPMMAEQYYLNGLGIKPAWDYLSQQSIPSGGKRDVVVAVIDTGVDYTQPDLVGNMWTNTAEIAGNGIDDDGNGYVDDIYGASIQGGSKTGDPKDDNGHGTHVAGIVASSANNSIGGVGVAYNVKIMAIKAGQASGVFSSSDIASAIYYAADKGADVINMSFGGYGRSILEEDALQVAYGTSVLVAAAGNDGLPNEGLGGRAMYPAAYPWVLGVMAESQAPAANGDNLASFSNYDVKANNSVEYEVMAPGVSIFSTLPGGNYAKWSGTSMAAPVVSGIAALVRSKYSDKDTYSSRFIMGQIASTGELKQGITPIGKLPIYYHEVNAYSALTNTPKPNLSYVESYIFDGTSIDANNNGDGVMDAGETIDIAAVIRNHWGKADNVQVKIDANSGAGIPDPYVSFVTDTVDYGAVGNFGTDDNGIIYTNDLVTGVKNPFVIKVASNTPNDHVIKLNITMTGKNGFDGNDSNVYSTVQSMSFTVRNAKEFPKVINQDMTLTKDDYWMISDKTLIEKGVTVTVEPGTQIQFWGTNASDPYAQEKDAYLQVEGTLNVNGTALDPVNMFTGLNYQGYQIRISKTNGGAVNLNYAKVMNPVLDVSSIDHCYFSQDWFEDLFSQWFDSNGNPHASWICPSITSNSITNSRFYQLGYKKWTSSYYPLQINSPIQNGNLFDSCVYGGNQQKFENNVFLKNFKLNGQEFGSRDYAVSTFNIGSAVDSNTAMQCVFPVKNPENGSTYIAVKPNLSLSGYDELKAVENYANELGGHVATIRDAAENEFVAGYINNYLRNNTLFTSTYPKIDYSMFGESYCKYIIGLNDFNSEGYFKWISNEKSEYTNWANGQPNDKYADTGYSWEAETQTSADKVAIDSSSGKWKDTDGNNYNVYIIQIPGTVYATSVTLDKETSSLGAGGSSLKLTATVSPSKTTNKNITWSSSNPDIAEVDNTGIVTPKTPGNAVITAKTEDGGFTDTCQVTVRTIVNPTGITLNKTSADLVIGKSDKLTALLTPEDCTETDFNWSSDNSDIVSVDCEGNITAKAEGSALIKATTADGNYSTSCYVRVVVPATGISLDKNSLSIVVGNSVTLNPSVQPAGATIKDVLWHSGNPNVATVDDNGLILAVGTGTVLITATTKDGSFKAYCPVTVTSETLSFVSTQISAGNRFSSTINNDGRAWAWGYNSYGQLGDGSNSNRTTPVLTNGITTASCISSSNYNTVIAKSDGTVWNVCNQTSTQIQNLKDVKAVSAGSEYTLALKKDGTVWALGNNYYGQLGDGSNSYRNLPVQVQNLTNVVSINASQYFSMALKSDGTVWTWGYNGGGQLGDGTMTNRNMPVQVKNLNEVTAISAGIYHALAVKNDGTVWGWGDCGYGCLGSYENRSTAVKIQGIDNVKSVSAGYYFSTALKKDGTVWTWGLNNVGQLGNGKIPSNDSNYTPNQISGISEVKQISSGNNHTLALKADGTIMAWGGNESGQLGNLSTENSSVPVQTLFGILPDTVLPTITAVTPADGSKDVDNNTNITVTFSEDVQQSSNFALITLQDSNGNIISLKSKNINDNVLTLEPITALSDGITYTVTIPAGAVKDMFGNDISGDYGFSFSTKDVPITAMVTSFITDISNTVTNSSGTGSVIGQTEIDNARKAFLNSSYLTTIKNNAFLNEWWDANTDHWMMFNATSGRNNIQYLSSNYWGTTNTELIKKAIVDYNSDFNRAKVISDPILTTAPETSYPFVTDIKVSTQSQDRVAQVGAEKITVTVSFNRDMDQNIQPQVSFGPDTPVTDYTVHAVNGGWSDARHWVGEFNINPITGDGYQFFRVAGAVAADDPWLVTGNDSERFRFEIITSGTESMKLQASGAEGKVQLSWAQDDFALLAGYNIYRSDSATGTYAKINSTLIPADQKSYDDTSVVPGKTYYYKFTVMKTDLGESDYSNVASAAPFDTIAPAISHTPVKGANVGLPLQIFADVTDNVAVKSATVYYRKTGTTDYQKLSMTNTTGSRYSAIIDGANVNVPGVDYYIEATDGNTVVRSGSPSTPYNVVITDAPKISSLSPSEGPDSGGTKVIISGSNFKAGVKVTFDGMPASDVVVESDSRITAVSPAHIPATTDVAVTNTGGYTDTLLRGFNYIKTGVDVSISDAQSNANYTLEIPINVSNVSGLTAADLNVAYDPEVLSLQGARTGNITTGFALSLNKNTPGTAVLSMASSNTVSGSGTLAYLQFKVLSGTKTYSALTLQSASLNGGNIQVNKFNGTFTISQTHSINGFVNYYYSSRPVSGFNVTLTGGELNNSFVSSSLADGSYSVTGIPDGDYVLKPTKSNDATDITSYDASLILQASAGTMALSDNQKLAADVNNDGKVDSMDAAYVLKKAAGLIDLPFSGAGKVWKTVEGNKTYAGLNGDLYNQNLTAILIGDVSGNWGSSGDPSVQSKSVAEFSLGSLAKESDGTFSIPVIVNLSEGRMFASDIVINYDSAAAEAVSVENAGLSSNFNIASNMSTPGVIRIAAAGAEPIANCGELFKIKFKSTNSNALLASAVIASTSVNENALASIVYGSSDVNKDKVIDIMDIAKVAQNYNSRKKDSSWNDVLDINKDGIVDIFDLVFLARKML